MKTHQRIVAGMGALGLATLSLVGAYNIGYSTGMGEGVDRGRSEMRSDITSSLLDSANYHTKMVEEWDTEGVNPSSWAMREMVYGDADKWVEDFREVESCLSNYIIPDLGNLPK